MENTKCKGLWLRWLAVAAYAGVLFYLSSLSRPSIPRFPFSDKVVHLSIYAGFGLVLAWAFGPWARGRPWRILGLAGLGALAYGVTDEFHQRFVLGRTPDAVDLAFDALGGLSGGAVYLAILYGRFRRKGEVKTDDPAMAPL